MTHVDHPVVLESLEAKQSEVTASKKAPMRWDTT